MESICLWVSGFPQLLFAGIVDLLVEEVGIHISLASGKFCFSLKDNVSNVSRLLQACFNESGDN